jgi:ribonuclease J
MMKAFRPKMKKRYKLFDDRNTLLLMTDSTNCENPGFSISDRVVYKNIESVIRDTPGRLMVSTFASQVERMLYMLETAERYGKKVVVEGEA